MTARVFLAEDEQATQRLGAALAASLPTQATIALDGTLGAGKTRLVQAIAAACGIPRDEVVSPTFVLCHEHHGTRTIYHLDAYRVNDPEELRQIGVFDFFEDDALTIIEWAERVRELLPEDYLQVTIDNVGEEARRFTMAGIGQGAEWLRGLEIGELDEG